MNLNDWDDDGEPPDDEVFGEEYRGGGVEELLAINWQLILRIEREQEEQRELAREFDEELDALFALIRSPDSAPDESPDPPGWPNL
ncbi:MAG: hypothetical protein ACREEM_25980 [Blastocatellia bacterium]